MEVCLFWREHSLERENGSFIKMKQVKNWKQYFRLKDFLIILCNNIWVGYGCVFT